MNRRPIYFYFRASWRRRRWHPSMFKHMLTPYEYHLCGRIERMLKRNTLGVAMSNSILHLIFQASLKLTREDRGLPVVPSLRFLRRKARRPGHAFYAPPGTKFKREQPEVRLA